MNCQICEKTVSKLRQHINMHKDETQEDTNNALLNGRKRRSDCLSK